MDENRPLNIIPEEEEHLAERVISGNPNNDSMNKSILSNPQSLLLNKPVSSNELEPIHLNIRKY